MTLSVNCSVVSSVKINLTFDDGKTKTVVVGEGDLVDVIYNRNGLRQRIYGRVIRVSVAGTDPNGWWITVDGSDDFEATQARFTVMNIIDIDMIKKYGLEHNITSPQDSTGIESIRVVNGRLQYTKDGYRWFDIRPIWGGPIRDEEGTVPNCPPPPISTTGSTGNNHIPATSPTVGDYGIEDEVYE